MPHDALIHAIFLIFAGAAVLSTIALVTRQSLLVAYMLLGVIIGPWGLGWVANADTVRTVGDVGIIFLLFLLGLHLPPQKLWHMLKKVSLVGLVSSLVFFAVGYVIAAAFGYNTVSCFVIGAAMIFSSTIIGIKLLPTTVLHHRHTGEVMISLLLLQDLLAIVVLLLMKGMSGSNLIWQNVFIFLFGLPAILLFAFLFERFILLKLFSRFDKIREYMFLLAIAWCLSMAQLANVFHLSSEIGAFVAGVTIASSPISLYIAESLKPVRDFFLVLFFFSVGAGFNVHYLSQVALPAILLALLLLIIKPVAYRLLLRQVNETKQVAWEVGFRLGQVSEFSLIVAFVALDSGLIGQAASYLIQATTIVSFVVSSYLVVMKYPTPIATSDKLRRD